MRMLLHVIVQNGKTVDRNAFRDRLVPCQGNAAASIVVAIPGNIDDSALGTERSTLGLRCCKKDRRTNGSILVGRPWSLHYLAGEPTGVSHIADRGPIGHYCLKDFARPFNIANTNPPDFA